MQKNVLANEANKQHCQELAKRTAATAKKALADKANKQSQAAAREKALADKAHEQCQMAKHATTLVVTVLTKLKTAPKVRYGGPPPTHFSPPLTIAEVAELDAAILNKRRCHETAKQEKALAKDKQRQEETTAIRHIRVECALLAAPLDTILAKIEWDNISHKAQAPPATTLPHPAAMLSTPPPPPYDLRWRGPFYDGGGALKQHPFL